MAEIQPFRGLRYASGESANPANLIAPPYDVISPDQKKEFLAKSPHNVVRLILPDGEDPYGQAARTLQDWIQKQILLREKEPSIYCYHQTFRTPDGTHKTRKGFLALIRLEEFDSGVVLPHEKTLAAPKEDRLQLLRACKTNFSPIFSLYSDPEQEIEALLAPIVRSSPAQRVVDSDDILNELWVVSDRKIIQELQQLMKERWVLIADGHHRYESCLMYRNEMMTIDRSPDAPFQYTLMFFCNLNHPGITVLPYNRGVSGLPSFDGETIRERASRFFTVTEFRDRNSAEAALKERGQNTTAFLARIQGLANLYLFGLKPETDLALLYPEGTPAAVQRLDVNVVHRVFLEAILGISAEDVRTQKYLKYYKSEAEERNDFDAGKLQIAFFLNPTRVDQVVEVSKAGKSMPQKSTFFYPKLMTGFVIRKMEFTDH